MVPTRFAAALALGSLLSAGEAVSQRTPRLLRDINPGPSPSGPDVFMTNGRVGVFNASDGRAVHLYRTDGTPGGTIRIGPPAGLDALAVGSHFVYTHASASGSGTDLCSVDSSGSSTVLLTATGSIELDRSALIGERVFFTIDDTGTGQEFGWTDGLTATVLDLVPGPSGSEPQILGRIGGSCAIRSELLPGQRFFLTVDSRDALTQWPGTDTAAATASMRVGDGGTVYALFDEALYVGHTATRSMSLLIPAPAVPPSVPTQLVDCVGDKLVFWRDGSFEGYEPHVSDGTVAGTFLLANLSAGRRLSIPVAWIKTAGLLAIVAGPGILVTDGRSAGTYLAHRSNQFISAGRNLWFEASDGRALINTTDVAAQTEGVWEIDARAHSSRFLGERFLTQEAVDGILLAPAFDSATGNEPAIWTPTSTPLAIRRGVSCGSSLETAELRATAPALGGVCSIRGLQPSGMVGLFLFGHTAPTVVSLPGYCGLRVDTARPILTAPLPIGTLDIPLPIPAEPALLGATRMIQAVYGPSSLPLGVELSNGVELTFR